MNRKRIVYLRALYAYVVRHYKPFDYECNRDTNGKNHVNFNIIKNLKKNSCWTVFKTAFATSDPCLNERALPQFVFILRLTRLFDYYCEILYYYLVNVRFRKLRQRSLRFRDGVSSTDDSSARPTQPETSPRMTLS